MSQKLQTGKARIVWSAPVALPAKIPEAWTRPFLDSRALWVSACPAAQEMATWQTWEAANQWVHQFCNTEENAP
jgi:hypothetical protein